MRDYILVAFFFSVLPFALARPYIGILVWSWLGYMNPHRLTYGFAYSFDFVKIAAAVTLIGLLFTQDKKKLHINKLTIIWLLFSLWTCLTTIFAYDQINAISELERMIKTQVMIAVTIMLMGSQKRINLTIWMLVISIGFFGIKGGIFSILSGGAFRVWGPPGSFIYGNNELALALIMTVPLMMYLFRIVEQQWLKIILLICMGLMFVSVITSYSRGAFLAVGAILLFLWFKSNRKIISAIVIVGLALAILSFMPEEWFIRMGTINEYDEDKSALGRLNAWMFAFNLALDKPLLGGGFGAFDPALFLQYAPDPHNYHDAHSIYFEVMGEQGFVGFFLFISMGLLIFTTGRKIKRIVKDNDELKWALHLANMLQVSIIGYASGGAFLGLAYFDFPYHLMALMVLLEVVVTEKLQEKAPDAEPITSENPEEIQSQRPNYFPGR